MAATTAWREQRGLPWEDVSLRRRGWDVEAGHGEALLRVEVKGSSLPLGAALLELRPNDFAKMKEHRDSFRLAVVTVASTAPTLAMFAWSHDATAWIANRGSLRLRLREFLAARVEVVKQKA